MQLENFKYNQNLDLIQTSLSAWIRIRSAKTFCKKMKYLLVILFLIGCKDNPADKKLKEMTRAPKPYLTLNILGRQWDWVFKYPNGEEISCHTSKHPNQVIMKPLNEKDSKDLIRFVTIPLNKVINFNLQSEKVLHSLAIPSFKIKKDAPIGKNTTVQFTAILAGTYIYSCDEMCGTNHGDMVGYIRVVSQKEYEEFLNELNKKKTEPKSGPN